MGVSIASPTTRSPWRSRVSGRTYSVTLAWSSYDETLRMICTFDMDPPRDGREKLFEMLNLVNDRLLGWRVQHGGRRRSMMVLPLRSGYWAGEQLASPDQIACIV